MRKFGYAVLVAAPMFFTSHSAKAQFLCQGMDGTAGGSTNTSGSSSVVCGVSNTNTSSQWNSTVIGYGNSASGFGQLAMGVGATSSATNGVSMGANTTASGMGAIAMGNSAIASGDYSLATGYSARAGAYQATSYGIGATANFANSTAIGSMATTTAAHQMMLGDYTTIYAMRGINNAASTTSQVGATKVVTADSMGNLATSDVDLTGLSTMAPEVAANTAAINTLTPQVAANTAGVAANTAAIASQQLTLDSHTAAINQVQTQIDSMSSSIGVLGAGVSALNGRVDGNQREARSGIAMAAAIAHAPLPSAPGKTTWRVNSSQFKGYLAHSVSLSHRLPTAVPLAVNASVAGGRAGVIVAAGLQGEF